MTKFLVSLILIALWSGCATPVGKTKFPEATSGYAPKASYGVGTDKLWEATLNALEKNRITVAGSDKASGSLQTDYIGGPSSLIGLGFIAAQNTRYKYAITIRGQSDSTTRLGIICKVESTMKGESGASPWTDVTGQNAELIRKLESWLYEQIEQELPNP